MRRYVAGLTIALIVAGFWTVTGPDSLANAQTGCVGEGAVAPGETELAADCEVLLDIRDTLAGTTTLDWSADTPIKDWEGISVGGTPLRVVVTNLSSRGLTGIIPQQLGNLSNLTELSLWGNQLNGAIPAQLGNLSNLTKLDLSGNELTGTIPQQLGSLSNLAELSLYGNQLNGAIPVQLGNLSNLTILWLDDNQLTGTIPTQLGSLSEMTDLNLGGNQLSGTIPSQLSSLSNLTELGLWDNQLTGTIPSQLGNLSELTWLDLSGNELTGTIPTQLGSLSELTELYLSGNELTGTIPTQLGSLSELTWLDLSDNQLTGTIPRSFTGLTNLTTFHFLDNDGLCAPTDSAFRTWLQGIYDVGGYSCDFAADRAVLVQLYNATDGANWVDSSNWLSNRPMGSWHGVTSDANGRVIGLYLWENRLSGSIPPELGDLSSLKWLFLYDNQLTGPIPPELGNLSNLTDLYLAYNRLTGCIPAALQSVISNDLDQLGLPICGIPTVTTSVDSANYQVRINSTIPVTATFSEPVNGFTAGDITIANGDVSNFIGSDGDSVYTFDVTPNAVGVVTVDIAGGVATDSDGEANTAAEQLTLGLPYDDDHDGTITLAEAIAAVSDYFSGNLSLDHAIAVVSLLIANLSQGGDQQSLSDRPEYRDLCIA